MSFLRRASIIAGPDLADLHGSFCARDPRSPPDCRDRARRECQNSGAHVSELVAWAKTSPAQANYGTPAAGSLPHLFGVTVGRTTGLAWVHVPYRGLAPMANDLMGGQISASFDALSN